MTDIEMQDASKDTKEVEKKEEPEQEPQDHFYGKQLWP
jgi:hypothetical protein